MGSLGYQAPFPFAIALDAQTGAGSLLPPGTWCVPGGLGSEQLQLDVFPMHGFHDLLQGRLNNLCHRE